MLRELLINKDRKERTVFLGKEHSVTLDELTQKAKSIQARLPRNQWCNIAILLPDGSDFIAALFGIFLLGKTAFPLNVHLTPSEIAPLLVRADVHIVITSTRFRAGFEEVIATATPSLQVIYTEDCNKESSAPLLHESCTDPDRPMLLLTTSGSTGSVKLVPLTERNIETSVYGYMGRMCYEDMGKTEIRYLLAAPFSSAYGLMILFACMIKRFPLIALTEGFTLDAFYQAVQHHKITHYEGGALVPLMMEQTAGRPIPYDIHLLKHFGFGGSKISGEALRKLLEAYPGIRLWQGYGMTEAAPLITKYSKTTVDKLDSVGRAIEGITLLIEADGIITDAPYINGEILVKGVSVMSGYYKNQAETDKVLKNGCLYTGDLGYLDEEGYLYINGRKKNVIIVRGFNVHPEEVESCLLSSLLVKDCVVYGEMDAKGNETVYVDIIPADPATDHDDLLRKIRLYCKENLSAYKQPGKILVVDIIQKTAAGKPMRKREALL